MDSGCSDHMCNNKTRFILGSLRKTNVTIRMGDDTTIQVDQVGRTCIGFLEIEALFVPQFRISLISVSKLALTGLRTIFDNIDCSVFNSDGQVFLKACLKNGLYLASKGYDTQKAAALITTRAQTKKARPQPAPPAVQQAPDSPAVSDFKSNSSGHRSNKRVLTDSLHLWHRRFAHMNPVALKQILEQTTPNEHKLINDHDPTCDICLKSKHQQKLNCTAETRLEIPFELIHSDSCGPITCSFGGSTHYILFIDDCTR